MKSFPLIINFLRLNQPILFGVFGLLYIALLIGGLASVLQLTMMSQAYALNGTVNIPLLVGCVIAIILLPLFPYILAWVQQDLYKEWMTKHARQPYAERRSS